jgi:hypothetical protein
MSWKFWRQNREPPPCGAEPPRCGEPPPQGGEYSPQCAPTPVQRAEAALTSLEQAWARAADAPQSGERLVGDPKELAVEFRRCLQAQPDLIGMGIHSSWVRAVYPLLCRAQGLVWAPPYKDFAQHLALLMPRRRADIRHEGRRTCTITTYRVLDPARSVVKLAAVERKRA